MNEINEVIAGPAGRWIGAVVIAAGIVLLTLLAKTLLLRKLSELAKQTSTSLDDAAVQVIGATRMGLVLILALYAGSHNLGLGEKLSKWLDDGAAVALFLQIGLWLAALLEFWIDRSRKQAMASNIGAATSLSALNFIAQVALWVLVTLLMLDNLGVNITALVAGLGISGIAVALAVQNILGDLFASLSIVIDKPFVIGDAISVDNFGGTVENVGLKTTRIRSNDGEQVIFSNSDLLKARIRNYKRMDERRVLFGFDVIYQTRPEQLEKIPGIVRGLIEKQKKVRFDRAHFQGFKDTALHYEVVYWILTSDYNLYMDTQQAINIGLIRELNKLGVTLAYSVTTFQPGQPPPAAPLLESDAS